MGEAAAAPLHVLSIATLFPDATRPNFGIFVERSLAALARQPGVALTVVAPVGLPPWPLSLHPRYRALRGLPAREAWGGLTVLRPRFTLIPWIGARLTAASVARAVLPTARALQGRGELDVIDAQFFWPDGPAARRLAEALDLPFSIKARGSDIAHWGRARATASAVRCAGRAADGLLSVSAALKAEMAALGLPEGRITVHRTGVDAGLFRRMDPAAARRAWDVPTGARLLLSVGALIPLKGHRHVIEAMRALPGDVMLAIAGTGPDEAALRALAQRLGLAARVRLLGAVAPARLAGLYNAADAMVLASEREGLANAWIEALACGTPLVLSDIPAAHEVVDAPDAGRIAARDPGSIARAVLEVLHMRIDRAALSARTHARHDWDVHGAELAAHLRSVAGRA